MHTDLLRELEPTVERALERHLATAKEWFPHEYVPWSEGRDYDLEPWEPRHSRLDPAAQAALELNLLTEDNLPSYHFEIAQRFGRDGAWGTWVHRWTAEEGRHAQCIRDYLLATRGVDPYRLERDRMETMQQGYADPYASPAETMVYVAFQELATRVSHRNTGSMCGEPVAERLLARVAADENLHMIFYRELVKAALAIDPPAVARAIHTVLSSFAMPGTVTPGYAKRAMTIAQAGVYDLRIHLDDVVTPVLRHWDLFHAPGLDGEDGTRALEDLEAFLADLDSRADRQRGLLAARAERAAAAAAAAAEAEAEAPAGTPAGAPAAG
jgi:acyl-[acyl-carrier-protein] desaturase